jgi:hypothetical protein
MQFTDPVISEGKPTIGVIPVTDFDRRYLKAVLMDAGSPLGDNYDGEQVIFDMTNLFAHLVPVRLEPVPAPNGNPATRSRGRAGNAPPPATPTDPPPTQP